MPRAITDLRVEPGPVTEFTWYPGDGIKQGDHRWLPAVHSPQVSCSAEAGFLCTRPDGHEGPHAAHGGEDQLFAVWPQDHSEDT